MPHRTTATRRNTSSLSLRKVTAGGETSHLSTRLGRPFHAALTCHSPFRWRYHEADHAVREMRPQEALETRSQVQTW
jgi:hypothetical protein